MAEPQIIIGGDHEGVQNQNLAVASERLVRGKQYQDLSTVMVMPTRGSIPARVVEALLALQTPMNSPFVRLFVSGMEVGDAYNNAVHTILNDPGLSKFRFLLTVEEDNLPPPDGLLRLFESIGDYDVVGGLYWTKGPDGQPMIYGDPSEPLNFRPQVPVPDTVQECQGMGMGFHLWKLDLFRELDPPWFVTVQEPARSYSQDLWFYERLRKGGYRVACDTRVRVGHLDPATQTVW